MPLKLSDKQEQGIRLLQNPDKTKILFTGGARCGKTYLICEFLVGRAFQFPKSRQLVVRKTRVSAAESFWNDTLTKYLTTYIPSSEYIMYKSELRVVFSNGSEIVIAGLDDEERAQKILGTEYITIFCNEATELDYKVVGTLSTRLAQTVYDKDHKFLAVTKMILDCNPREPTHWLKIWGVDFKDPTSKPHKILKDAEAHAVLHWIPEDNIANLPPRYIEEHLDTLPAEQRERMRYGKWVGREGAIFKEFSEKIHVCKFFVPPRSWSRTVAIDFGFDHPVGILYSAYDYVTDTIYAYREFKKSGLTINQVAKYLKDTQEKNNEFYETIWADHDKSDRAFLAQEGIVTRAAKKSVLDGITAIQNRLQIVPRTQKPRIMIMDCCQQLIEEMYSYSWHKNTSEVADTDKPIKIDDDLVDPFRYIVYGRDKTIGLI